MLVKTLSPNPLALRQFHFVHSGTLCFICSFTADPQAHHQIISLNDSI